MVRTQIYLTEHQRSELAAIAMSQGKRQSEVIREAIDLLLERISRTRRQEILRKAAGIWKDRNDLPDFRELRAEWERY